MATYELTRFLDILSIDRHLGVKIIICFTKQNFNLENNMEIFRECVCPTEQISVDISTTEVPKETEDLEEIDKDELIEDESVSHNKIWQEISDQFDEERRQIEQYKLSKATECEVPLSITSYIM